jgi:hypothetical protein
MCDCVPTALFQSKVVRNLTLSAQTSGGLIGHHSSPMKLSSIGDTTAAEGHFRKMHTGLYEAENLRSYAPRPMLATKLN